MNFTKNTELNELYVSLAIRHFCLAIIGTFVPLYFIKIGLSLQQVFVYYAIVSFFQLVGLPFATQFASKYGFKHSMSISSPLTIGFFVILYLMTSLNWWLIVVAGLLSGFGNIFFRMGMHLDAAKNSHGKFRGSELGTIKIVESLFKSIAPLIGGLILAFLSYQVLFIVICICLLASSIPLFLSIDYHEPIQFDILRAIRGHKLKHSLHFIASGFEFDANIIIWPIAIYYILKGNYESIGQIASASLFVSVLSLYLTSKWVNKNRKQVMKIASFGLIVTWLFRSIIRNGWQLFALESVHNSLENGYTVAEDSIIYDRSEVQGLLKYIFYYQLMLNIGRLSLFVILCFIPNYEIGLLFGVFGSLVMRLI